MRSVLALVASLLLLLLLAVAPASAHVRFVVNTGAAGTSGFLTYLKVPHGCAVSGNDTGDDPASTVEVSTRQIVLKVPPEIGSPLPSPIPLWNLTYSTQGTYTVFTWTASPGNELEHWQALAIPIFFNLPNVAITTRFTFPTMQYCLYGGVGDWTTSPPYVTVTNSTSTTTTTTTTSATVIEDPDVDKNRSISVAAIVIAAIVVAAVVAITYWYSIRVSKIAKSVGGTSARSTELSSPLRETASTTV